MVNRLRLLVVPLLFLLGCSSGSNVDTENSNEKLESPVEPSAYEINFKRKQSSIKTRLFGMKSESLNQACETVSSQIDNCLLMVIKNTDCQSCLDIGENFIKSDNLKDFIKTYYVIGNNYMMSSRVSFDHIYYDERHSLTKELGFFNTPSLISYSEKKGIMNIYLIPTFDDSLGLTNFSMSLTN